MAPIPDHLKRPVPVPTDVSSQILTSISETPQRSLSAEVAGAWVAELESCIRQTKSRIHERIQSDLPDFGRQLETAKSVQARLANLTANVDTLSVKLSDSHSGLLPHLLRSLRAHSELAQQTADARVTYDTLAFLSRCRAAFSSLTNTVQQGKLEDGFREVELLTSLLRSSPPAVSKAQLVADLRNQLRALKDRIEEQRSEAFSRSIRISATEFRITPSVYVRQSTSVISLSAILSSMSKPALETHLSPLLRDIGIHYVDFPLQQAVTAEVNDIPAEDGSPSICLSIFPLSPSADARRPTLLYIKTLVNFLDTYLLPAFPSEAASRLIATVRQQLSTGLRDIIIKAALPNSLSGLEEFLDFLKEAIELERSCLLAARPASGFDGGNGVVEEWANEVAGHFGRKRKNGLLYDVRQLILSSPGNTTIRVEAPERGLKSFDAPSNKVPPPVIAVQGGEDVESEDAWDFDDNSDNIAVDSEPRGKTENNEDAWDFEDDPWEESNGGINDNLVPQDVVDSSKTSNGSSSTNGNGMDHISETSGNQDDSTWGLALDDGPVSEDRPPSPSDPPTVAVKVPKVAKGLEKLKSRAKEKDRSFGTSSADSSSRLSSSFTSSNLNQTPFSPGSQSSSRPTSPFSQPAPSHKKSNGTLAPKPDPLTLGQPTRPKEPETFLISGRAQDLIKHTFRTLDEAASVYNTSVFSISCQDAKDAAHTAGSIISQAAPSSLALFRAVYPVAHGAELAHSTQALRFANECAYIAGEIAKGLGKARDGKDGVKEQMEEEINKLEALSSWWFDQGIERECTRISRILERAEDFVDMGDQERYDTCEDVMTEVLRGIRAVSNEWKRVLSKTQHLTVTGRIVEHALTYVLDSVLALPDIPEVDSRRLAELCRVLAALEGLFVIDTGSSRVADETSSLVVAYVPSWLKFSYLSELLEASLADLTYLFEQGALIDFNVDELVPLVRALFADTPARSNALAKIMRGHPTDAVGS